MICSIEIYGEKNKTYDVFGVRIVAWWGCPKIHSNKSLSVWQLPIDNLAQFSFRKACCRWAGVKQVTPKDFRWWCQLFT